MPTVNAQPIAKTVDHSVYIGIQGGIAYDKLKDNEKIIPEVLSLKKDQKVNLSGRIFMGYNFNKNFALEGGFLMTDQRDIKAIAFNKEVITKFKIKEHILDLTPRINIPLGDKFTAYARGGVVYIDAFNTGKDKKEFNLTYGLGLDYHINNSASVGVSWSHYNGGSTKPIDIIYKKYEPALNFYTISISYKFNV